MTRFIAVSPDWVKVMEVQATLLVPVNASGDWYQQPVAPFSH